MKEKETDLIHLAMEAAETKGRGGGEGRKCRREEEEAFAAKSRRIDDQDDEERMNNYTPMLEEEEDGCRDSRCAELVFGEEEEELDPVQMEEKLRQVKLEMKGKYSYTDELDEEEQMRRYHTSWDSSLSPHYGPFQRTSKYSHFITVSIHSTAECKAYSYL